MSKYPDVRLRRLRRTEAIRRLVAETALSPSDLVYPLFVTHGRGVKNEIESMPGIYQFSADLLLQEAKDIAALGLKAVILFGIPEKKDGLGSEAYRPDGVVQQAIRAIKESNPGLAVVTDVCLCEYTDHGHCGVVADSEVDNDRTLELLSLIHI